MVCGSGVESLSPDFLLSIQCGHCLGGQGAGQSFGGAQCKDRSKSRGMLASVPQQEPLLAHFPTGTVLIQTMVRERS